ncbi:DUF4192 domain-containing protein [Kitasatospora indigofera]|uniref:DUF4192 domain-containing protein n=1 Tax=Kitasatospora indigofera TaxID=67307 RepID=UPI0036B6D17A
MNEEHGTPHPDPIPGRLPVRMRGPADMAELLPYLLGFFPDDSIVAVGLQGADLQQGGVIRVDIPEAPADWPRAAAETAALLVRLSEQRDHRPEQVLLYLCRDPEEGEARPVLGTLGPLAEALRTAFEAKGVGVKESLCVSGGRWWSFLCRREGCCESSGNPVQQARGPGPVVAAATFAGLAPRGSRKAIAAGLAPLGEPAAGPQRLAIEQALRHRPLTGGEAARERAGELLDEVMAEFLAGAREVDERRTALLLVGLQDKLLRDRAAEYAESAELGAAQRLWRFLARRCVIPFDGYAAAPLTLLAWTSWLAGDLATARVVLGLVLRLDPDYLLAQLLHESLNGGLAPELLLEGVRAERARRAAAVDPAPRSGSGTGERRPRSGRRTLPGPLTAAEAPYDEEGIPSGPDDGREPGPVPGRSVRTGQPEAPGPLLPGPLLPGPLLPGRRLSARTRAAVRRRRRATEALPGPGSGLRAWGGAGHRCGARGTAARS